MNEWQPFAQNFLPEIGFIGIKEDDNDCFSKKVLGWGVPSSLSLDLITNK